MAMTPLNVDETATMQTLINNTCMKIFVPGNVTKTFDLTNHRFGCYLFLGLGDAQYGIYYIANNTVTPISVNGMSTVSVSITDWILSIANPVTWIMYGVILFSI